MELVQMQKSLQDYTKSLFLEGILDSQFLQLQQLQDESNPDFVSQVVTLFFQDSDRILNDLTLSLDQQVVDFKKVDPHVHQLKGSSSSIGAQRVKNACVVFRSFCEQQNVEACHRCLQQVKQEYYLVKKQIRDSVQAGATDCIFWWDDPSNGTRILSGFITNHLLWLFNLVELSCSFCYYPKRVVLVGTSSCVLLDE